MSAYPNSPTHGEGGHAAGHAGHTHDAHEHTHGGCVPVPEFKRLNYFYGQMLGAADFRAEQQYFREKLKLHNRCLHGYGVVCGLRVVPEPIEQPCAPEDDARIRRLHEEIVELEHKLKEATAAGDVEAAQSARALIEEKQRELDRIRVEDCEDGPATRVVVECGIAIDCEGNELVVRRPVGIDLWRELSRADRKKVKQGWSGGQNGSKKQEQYEQAATVEERGEGTGNGGEGNGGNGNGGNGGNGRVALYVSICYCEQPTDPARPVMADACGATPECNYGRLRDSFKIRVTTEPPEADDRCATCCEACADPCLLLARIDNFRPGQPLDGDDIHNEVRRPLSLHVPTVITGISWTDGAEYTEAEAESLLGLVSTDDPSQPRGYLLVRFSRAVHVSTIRRGVIDIWVTQGGGGRRADLFNVDVEFLDLPETGMTDRVRFRAVSDESPNPGDRVMFIIRGAHLLDACCRPVDAANTGGRTPFVADDEFKEFRRESQVPECRYPPPFGYGPWTSGTSAAGADHVSWIYIKSNPRYGQKS